MCRCRATVGAAPPPAIPRWSNAGAGGALDGPPGSGKTLLARQLASRLGRPAVHLTFPAVPAAELLAMVAEEIGELAAPPTSWVAALRHLRGRLAAMAVQGIHPLLAVRLQLDEAIRDPATFEALRLLLNFATDGALDLSLLLVGGTEFLTCPAAWPTAWRPAASLFR